MKYFSFVIALFFCTTHSMDWKREWQSHDTLAGALQTNGWDIQYAYALNPSLMTKDGICLGDYYIYLNYSFDQERDLPLRESLNPEEFPAQIEGSKSLWQRYINAMSISKTYRPHGTLLHDILAERSNLSAAILLTAYCIQLGANPYLINRNGESAINLAQKRNAELATTLRLLPEEHASPWYNKEEFEQGLRDDMKNKHLIDEENMGGIFTPAQQFTRNDTRQQQITLQELKQEREASRALVYEKLLELHRKTKEQEQQSH